MRFAALLAAIMLLFTSLIQPHDRNDELFRQLQKPDGKVEYFAFMNPGGPILRSSDTMKELAAQGTSIQPRLLKNIDHTQIRNEVALILKEVGDQNALLPLIELLPQKDNLTEEEKFTTMCRLKALWQLTGMWIGINHKFPVPYTPNIRNEWLSWYEENKPFLYLPPNQRLNSWGYPTGSRIRVDVEAKIAGRTTEEFRREHPWIEYHEIQTWRDDPAYEQKLKDYCFTQLLNPTDDCYVYAPGLRDLCRLHDAKSLSAIHALCSFAKDEYSSDRLIWTLKDRGDPSSLAVIERMPKTKSESDDPGNEKRRQLALERIRLLQKYAKEIKNKPFSAEQQTRYLKCLDGSKGVEELIADLRKRDNSCIFLSYYLHVAGYVDREPVRQCLKEMARDETRSERQRTLIHAAQARLGETDSLNHLKKNLSHDEPGVRLAAAEGLWKLGRKDGFQILVAILALRPIESGREGVTVHDNGFKVSALRETNVEYIRSACRILGEMGDKSAIAPLHRLRTQNLNGVLGGGGSGTGWPGRPDVVALAKLGDDSAIDDLRASIRAADWINAAGHFDGYLAIGKKRYIPDLLPLLGDDRSEKRVNAAAAILILFEQGH